MIYYPMSLPNFDPFGERVEEDPYEVLTLHREWDNKCIVRLNGFDNLVFWKEINLAPRFSFGKSPRQKILDAQDKAKKKAEELR